MIDRMKLATLRKIEDERFIISHPKSGELFEKAKESVVEPDMPGAAVAVSLGHHFEWAPAPTADEIAPLVPLFVSNNLKTSTFVIFFAGLPNKLAYLAESSAIEF